MILIGLATMLKMISTAKHSFTFPHPTSPCFFPFLPRFPLNLNTNPLGFICPIFGSRRIAKRKQKVYWEASWNFAQKANVIGEVGKSNRWKLFAIGEKPLD